MGVDGSDALAEAEEGEEEAEGTRSPSSVGSSWGEPRRGGVTIGTLVEG